MPSTPAAGEGRLIATRSVLRLTVSTARCTGAAFGAVASKPTSPKDGATGAAAVLGAETATVPGALVGVAASGACVAGAAEAGMLNEATRPPETARTAEALAAGWPERPRADVRAVVVVWRPAARWRPAWCFDTMNRPLQCLRGELSGSGGRYAPGPEAAIRP